MGKKLIVVLTLLSITSCYSMQSDKSFKEKSDRVERAVVPAPAGGASSAAVGHAATENTVLLVKDEPVQCAICLGPFREPKESLPCGHVFCAVCLEGCRANGHTKCPLCRHAMNDWSVGIFAGPSHAFSISAIGHSTTAEHRPIAPVTPSVIVAPHSAPRIIVFSRLSRTAEIAEPPPARARTCCCCQQRCQQCYRGCADDCILCHNACIVPCCNSTCRFCPCGDTHGTTYCCTCQDHRLCNCCCAVCSLTCAACLKGLCCCSGCNGNCPGYDQCCKPCINTLCCTNNSSSCCCCYSYYDDEGGSCSCSFSNHNCWISRTISYLPR